MHAEIAIELRLQSLNVDREWFAAGGAELALGRSKAERTGLERGLAHAGAVGLQLTRMRWQQPAHVNLMIRSGAVRIMSTSRGLALEAA